MITGIIFGCFDLFHVGHLNALKQASLFCAVLHVGVFSDKIVTKYKKQAPIIPQEQRLAIVQSLNIGCEIKAYIEDIREIRDLSKYGYVFVSERLKDKKLAMVEDNSRTTVVYIHYTDAISTSWIRARIHRGE